nr:MAG TPA: hypothetical protein [Caudoviricetes sp.]
MRPWGSRFIESKGFTLIVGQSLKRRQLFFYLFNIYILMF